jgi:hypothetical protein
MFAPRATWLPSIAALAASGCAVPWPGADGTQHYVVVGIGVCSVPSMPPDVPVTAVKVQAVGIVATATPGPRLVVGYTKSYQMEAAADARSVLLEMSDSLAGPLKIRTQIPDSQESDQ